MRCITLAIYLAQTCVNSPAYLLVEWDGENEHSVIDSKIAQLLDTDRDRGYVPGSIVSCTLKEGVFQATILTAG